MRSAVTRRTAIPLVGLAAATLALAVACNRDVPTSPLRPSRALASVDPTANPDSIHLSFICDTRFRVRNHNDLPAPVDWVVVGTTDQGSVLLPARQAGTPYSETFFETEKPGTVQLFFAGKKIEAAKSDTTACPIHHLDALLGAGVTSNLASTNADYSTGTAITYSFSAASGYTNVKVILDDTLAASSGTIVMSQHHSFWATADVAVPLPSASDPLVMEIRGLLDAADAVTAYQQLIDDVSALNRAVGMAEATRQVRLAGLVAYDMMRDSAKLVRLDDALALHEFGVTSSEYDGSGGGSGGGGGGEPTSRSPVAGPSLTRAFSSARRMVSALADSCAPQRAPDVAGSPEPTRVLYVNGMATPPEKAASTMGHLECELSKAGQLSNSTVKVRHFYNRAWGPQVIGDTKANMWCLMAGSQWGGIHGEIQQLLSFAICTGQTLNVILQTQTYLEQVKEYAQIKANFPGIAEDADSLSRYLNHRRKDDGEHVVIMAHSQGNMITQQAVRALQAAGGYAPRTDSLCLAAMSIAAPTSAKWPIDPPYLIGIQVKGDVVPLLTNDNKFPVVQTALSDSVDAVLAKYQAMVDFAQNPKAKARYKKWKTEASYIQGLRIHAVDESYLGQTPALDQITGGIAQLHRQCTVGALSLNMGSTLRVQKDMTIGVEATNRNGGSMNLNRTVQWTAAPELTLSRSLRKITATVPGNFGVAVRVFDRRAQRTVRVNMEPLTVTANQTAKSSWRLFETDAPGGWKMPDPGPGPAWSGVEQPCDQEKFIRVHDGTLNVDYTWHFAMHCWYSAAGTVKGPEDIKIVKYTWRWTDNDDRLRDAPTNKLTAYSPVDMPVDEPLVRFIGWKSLEVWGLNANGDVIAKGNACISNCAP